MLLQELIGIKQYAGNSLLQAVKDIAEKHGVKAFQGGFGVVLIPKGDTPYVYKAWLKDSAYEYYLKTVMANQSNRFFPKVYGKVVELKNITSGSYKDRHGNAIEVPTIKVVRLEKLYKGDASRIKDIMIASVLESGVIGAIRHDSKEAIAAALREYFSKLGKKEMAYKADSKSGKMITVDRTIAHNIRSEIAAYNQLKKYNQEDLVEALWQIYEALVALDNAAPDHEHGTDLHGGNVMFRKNGELVITDPFSTTYAVELK